jgi:hypothetical protein
MVDQSELRRRQALTFEEAEGLVPTPTQFRDGELTREFRNGVWTAFYRMFSDNRLAANYSARPTFAPLLAGILFRELLNRRQTPIDEADKRIKKWGCRRHHKRL